MRLRTLGLIAALALGTLLAPLAGEAQHPGKGILPWSFWFGWAGSEAEWDRKIALVVFYSQLECEQTRTILLAGRFPFPKGLSIGECAENKYLELKTLPPLGQNPRGLRP